MLQVLLFIFMGTLMLMPLAAYCVRNKRFVALQQGQGQGDLEQGEVGEVSFVKVVQERYEVREKMEMRRVQGL